ncbi:MAG: bacillithiol biosynthesis cysteine-adding enzyme BshC [Blastocatellia bacterium]|nr:bacillithiol biosynthesis cysteine-adding enzyme BshC [Blastocatellia bacterium]
MTTETIRFSDIPKTSQLFQDFLYDFQRVESFYEAGARDWDALIARAKRVAAQNFNREAVADVLLEQNRNAGAGEATLANIERLRQNDSVVIITGQQAGLFTGPLYTVFKALTAIKLAHQLREKNVNAIPVFWIAAEDHDFAEVNHTRLVNRDGQLVTITYTACSPAEGKPVGAVTLKEGINDNLDELIAALPESEFTPQLAADLRESYQPGTGFADAFGKMMMKLFGKFGVVLINPLDDRFKQIAGTIYSQAMQRAPEFADVLVKQSAALEAAGYHAQVYTSTESVPLFMMDEGRRTALMQRDGHFYLKGREKQFGREELLETVNRCPACFSPNVTLRPIVQDFLLPTAVYIGGPAEIAYFAQLRAGYQLLGRIEPLVLSRASFTLLEKRHAKTLSKNGLQFSDLFAGLPEVITKVAEQSLDKETAATFDETEQLFEAQLEKLQATLQKVDPPLAAALKGGRANILSNIHRLRATYVKNVSQRDEATRHQLERAFAVLYPNKGLQEREINVSYFLARYGYELLDRIYDEVTLEEAGHQVLPC